MVVHTIQKYRCDRCGATDREARLTVSHSPHNKLALIASAPIRLVQNRKYILCDMCRQIHYKMERNLLWKACVDIAQLHEDYLNQ